VSSRGQDTKQSEDGVVYGAGAKSAGSIDAAPATVAKGKKGQTSLTGKNPFAILKASAIASVSPAAFPNNFTNLPKAFPPFLPRIQADKEYCLVLDLDETLIHNVEVSFFKLTFCLCSMRMKATF
jgi:hypothetical protein